VADRLFDPFVTDKQDEGGTGLGLSVTYSLVQAHHGLIDFSAQNGGGTVFTISLPVIDQPKRSKILIADDNASIRELLTVALSDNNAYRIEEASNGIEACIRLGTHLPDLLILDLFMPEVDGLEVCKIIKSNPDLEGLKVLIITGFPEHPKVNAVEKLGFVDIHYKPFHIAELKKTIDRLLNT
jgi:CheY-like chemotaxis protein